MRRKDIALPRPFTSDPMPTTASGDLALVSGLPSYVQARKRAMTCTPGAMLHRPEFGAGTESFLGLSGLAVSQRLASAIKAQLYRDRRTRAGSVRVTLASPTPGRFDISYSAQLVDGTIADDSL